MGMRDEASRIEAAVQGRLESDIVRAGFIPLVDCAPLVVAAELGFARAEGLDLRLQRESSWASIRDKVNLGHLDCAHMLAAMPLAATLGAHQVRVAMCVPIALNLGGNAITVSRSIAAAMRDGEGLSGRSNPAAAGRALAACVRAAPEPFTFATVYPFSAHNYALRYWLAAAGIDPDRDVRLVALPPPLMVDSLRAGHIDGFCVGEPWNSLAVASGIGEIVTSTAAIWNNSPEKVLGVTSAYATRHPATLAALVRAVFRAAAWADAPAHRRDLALILADRRYLDAPAELIRCSLDGNMRSALDVAPFDEPDFLVFHRNAATFPWRSHALWFYAQMVRWRQVVASEGAKERVAQVYRPDLYRAALAPIQVAIPSEDGKSEGTHPRPYRTADGVPLGADLFFDGATFDREGRRT